jgi:AraC-type DNA-binding domain-containing proteins
MVDNAANERINNRNLSYQHPPYVLERKLITCIQHMDESSSVKILDQINKLERASLSDLPLRSLKDSIVASCTIFTRAIIDGGADTEGAFSLSDTCIRRLECLRTVKEVEQFEYEILREFISLLVKENRYNYSHIINKTINFIKQNLQHKLTLQNIAEEVNVHPNYLSALFKKQVGMNISSYIEKQRSEAIRLFIIDTELSLTDIAFTFDFSSVSYFSSFFKKNWGISPLKYRQLNGKT